MIIFPTSQLPSFPKRIISLVPSQTELLYNLHLNEEVIGITKFCIHPRQWFLSKKRIGGTKNINIKLINELNPDLIIANKEENDKLQIDELARHHNIWITDVKNLHDALQMIGDIGQLTGKQLEATNLTQQISKNFNQLIPTPQIPAAYLIWKDPYMTIGFDTFINDMMKKCGLNNIFSHKTRYPQITIEQIKQLNCRLVLLSSEPYPFKQEHANKLARLLPNCTICLVDGEYFSWYGSRLLDAPGYFNQLLQQLQFI
ncbi:MAG: ABC transporter substrate-binding protein [Chitinophagaceae bacterium]|nr:ABC transporter substrate-binding protein [Chitinophagaceae bacterium]